MEKVNHPSLPDHPDHALYQKYFPNGGASIFTFKIKGGREGSFKFIDNLKIFSLLANVADVKSLVIHPASTTHSQLNEQELLAEEQIYQNTIRLSIGTEHIDDIIADLEQVSQPSAASKPVTNVSKDLFAVQLHQQLMPGAGVQLDLDVLHTGIQQALDRPLYACALFAHRVGIACQEQQGQILGHPGQKSRVVQPQDAAEHAVIGVQGKE